jgi:hypothetical protein
MHPTERGGKWSKVYTKGSKKVPACYLFVLPDGSLEWNCHLIPENVTPEPPDVTFSGSDSGNRTQEN